MGLQDKSLCSLLTSHIPSQDSFLVCNANGGRAAMPLCLWGELCTACMAVVGLHSLLYLMTWVFLVSSKMHLQEVGNSEQSLVVKP